MLRSKTAPAVVQSFNGEVALPTLRRSPIAIEKPRTGFPWFALLPLLGLPWATASQDGYELVVFSMAVLFLLAGTANPVWALCGLMLSELTLRNGYLPFGGVEVSNRLFLSLLAAAVVLPHLPLRRPLLAGTGGLAFCLFGFFILASTANFATSGAGSTFQLSRYLATGLLLAVLMALLLRNRSALLTFAGFCGAVAAISAALSILQSWGGAGAFGLVEGDFGARSTGLTESPILLSNDLLLIAFFPLAALFQPGVGGRMRRVALAASGVLLAGLFFSGTRSWLVAFVPAAVCLGLLLEGHARRSFFAVLLVGAVGGGLLLASSASRYTVNLSEESSAASRPVLWGTSYLIINDNPLLGIGRDRYKDYSLRYSSRLPDSLRDEMYASRALGRFSPHQDFLNVWVSFGAVAFLLYCGIFILAISAFLAAHRLHAGDAVLQAISAGGLAALVAYAVNSSFHNLLEVTWSLWFLGGLAAALLGLAALRGGAQARQPT